MEETLQLAFDYHLTLDAIEYLMKEMGSVDIPHSGVFSPGMYTRSIIVPPDYYLLSYIHKTKHQFILSYGKIVIYTPDEGMVFIHGPYLGMTEAGTQRFAKTLSLIAWTTIHPTSIQPADDSEEAFKEAEKLVEAELFETHENIFLIKAEKGDKLCLA